MENILNLHRLSGLIDADGGIRLEQIDRGRTHYPLIYLHSTSKEIIRWLHENYGGSISNKKRQKEHHNMVQVWSLRGRKAISLCEKLYPLLLETGKKERARLIATEYLKLTPRNGKYTEAQLADRKDFIARVSSSVTRAKNMNVNGLP